MGVEPDYCDDIRFDDLNDIQISTSHSVFSTLQSDNNLKKVMTKGNTYYWSDYENDIVHAALPWIAFAIFASIILILAICIRFLRCVCCKQRIKERGRCIKLTCVSLSFIITLLSLLTCSFILYYSDQTFQSIQQVQCAGGKFPYVLKNGNKEKEWGGMDRLRVCTLNISNGLANNFNGPTTTLWKPTGWLTDNTIANPLSSFVQKYNYSEVTSPYPYENREILTNYTVNLGPVTNKSSEIGMIYYDYMTSISPIVSQMVKIKTVTQGFQSNLSQMINFSLSVNTQMQDYSDGINTVKDNIDNWIINYMPQIEESWRGFTFWVVVWGWFICTGVLITVYSQAMSKYAFAHGLCCFWLFCGIVAIIGFLATSGTLAVGLVVRDSCELIDDLFTENGMSEYDLIIPVKLAPLTRKCILGNGNLTETLNLGFFLNQFQELENYYEGLAKFHITTSLVDLPSVQTNIQMLSQPINYYNVPIKSVSQTDSPQYNLLELNKFTNNLTKNTYQVNCETGFSDLWVFYKNECSGYTYIEEGPEKVDGNKSCLVLNEWDIKNITSRYQGINCNYNTTIGSYKDTIIVSVGTLQSYIDSVDVLYEHMLKDLVSFNDTLTDFVLNLINLNGNIDNYFDSPNQILYLMQSTVGSNGLAKGLDCSVIQPYDGQIKKSLCDNSLENIYQVFVFVFLLSFLMLIMELLNLYLSRALLKGIEIY